MTSQMCSRKSRICVSSHEESPIIPRYFSVVYQNQFFSKIADTITGALHQAMLTGAKTEKQSQLKIGQLGDNVLEAQVDHLSALWTIQPRFARQVRNDEWRGIRDQGSRASDQDETQS